MLLILKRETLIIILKCGHLKYGLFKLMILVLLSVHYLHYLYYYIDCLYRVERTENI